MKTSRVEFRDWAKRIGRLHEAVAELLPAAAEVGVSAPTADEWYGLLVRKLMPQLAADPYLVVAVVGGTNIGKSAVFNHLAGETASGVSPLAARTRHPVCLVPAGIDIDLVRSWFDGFEPVRWQSPEDPLIDRPEHTLYWREGRHLSPRLLLLDTPDIDSDAVVNWERADRIRQSADVLLAVLTQQKYNDAAVKQFFRQAVEADKSIVIVFNQCDLVADRPYWPRWLRTFCDETKARPELVYVAPYDRAAAEEIRLPFFPVGPQAEQPPDGPVSLPDELATLHFDEIKIRSCYGAVARLLDTNRGVGSYLESIRHSADRFRAASQALSAKTQVAAIVWPTIPPTVVVEEIRRFWDENRSNWARTVHGAYRRLGATVAVPLRRVRDSVRGPRPEPAVDFAARESAVVLQAVEGHFNKLEELADVADATLRPRLERLLSGASRTEVLSNLKAAHKELPTVDAGFREFLHEEMTAWFSENPRAVRWLRSLDNVLAVARPAVTVSLAVGGWFVAGEVVAHAATEAAAQAATHTAGELAAQGAVTTAVAGGGETVMGTTLSGARHGAARLLRRLEDRYVAGRRSWLADWLDRELLGDLWQELRHGASISGSAAFREAEAAVAALEQISSPQPI